MRTVCLGLLWYGGWPLLNEPFCSWFPLCNHPLNKGRHSYWMVCDMRWQLVWGDVKTYASHNEKHRTTFWKSLHLCIPHVVCMSTMRVKMTIHSIEYMESGRALFVPNPTPRHVNFYTGHYHRKTQSTLLCAHGLKKPAHCIGFAKSNALNNRRCGKCKPMEKSCRKQTPAPMHVCIHNAFALNYVLHFVPC